MTPPRSYGSPKVSRFPRLYVSLVFSKDLAMQCGFAIKKLQLGEEPKPPLRLATRAMEKSARWECSSEIFEWTQAEIPENGDRVREHVKQQINNALKKTYCTMELL